MKPYLRAIVISCIGFSLAACTSTTIRTVDLTPPAQAKYAIAEDQLLDVGIVVFESNIPDAYDDLVTKNITPEIRRAEANYIAHYAKELLQETGNWGAVRVIPRASHAVDVTVTGGIVHSDGERLVVAVQVMDSRGEIWFETLYETLASKYAYEHPTPRRVDPFQSTYRYLADDMLRYREALSTDEIRRIRMLSLMRFAIDFTPDAFASYVDTNEKEGTFHLKRLPAENDPNMGRVRKVREREFLFIDTLAEYYNRFFDGMHEPYQNWRHGTYEDAIAIREQRNRARARLIAGSAMVLTGAMAQRSSQRITEYAGYASVIGGASEIVGAIQNHANVKIHAAALQEMGVSAAKEIVPYTIELENATISLQGTVDEQFEQLRKVIKQLYYEDLGVAIPEEEYVVELETPERLPETVTEEFFEESS